MRFALKALLLTPALAAAAWSCGGTGTARGPSEEASRAASAGRGARAEERAARPFAGKMIYVVVALCDNVNQGIVPVPASLGNGEDPARNLYWGARFGVKTFFRNRPEWQLVSEVKNPSPKVLERLVFRHRRADAYLVADAYRGAEIKQATADFLASASGNSRETFAVGADAYSLGSGASAHLVAYVGHNGLMDFRLAAYPKRRDEARRDAVILACVSKNYFADALREAGAEPLLWTTNLMAPEAYVLNAAVEGWLAGDSGEQVRQRAARAYHSYQNCGLKAAQKLFANGW